MISPSVFRRTSFWIVCGFLAALAAVSSVFLFPKAFPVLKLDISMDHSKALSTALEIAHKEGWGPDGFRQAAQFKCDESMKTFVELEGGGAAVFQEMLSGEIFSPYTWMVRHFTPKQEYETYIWFRPDGKPFGFLQNIPESWPGQKLSRSEAKKLGEEKGESDWGIRMEEWDLVEQKEETKSGGRLDHSLTYERRGVQIGEARYRMVIDVAGDQVAGVRRWLKIPEAFERRLAQMRSGNEALSGFASTIYGILYITGAVAALGWLGSKGRLIWKTPLWITSFLVALAAIATWNLWPAAWLQYNTSVEEGDFVKQFVLNSISQSIGTFLMLALSFCAAESLSRYTFPDHPQLWRVWRPSVAAASSVWGRTLGGYLMACLDLLYVCGFYLIATHFWGWWTPAEHLSDPNILATRVPWVGPIARAAEAGMAEECLFRALPLSAGVLLGRRTGRPVLCTTLAIVFQSFVFAAGHANYESFPAYSRMVELLLPSMVWGVLFLRFGLLPIMLSHFLYDAVLMSMPLFATHFEGAWVHRAACLSAMFLPLGITALPRILAQSTDPLPKEARNGGWLPPPTPTAPPSPLVSNSAPPIRKMLPLKVQWGVSLGSAVVFIGLAFSEDKPLSIFIQRRQAAQIARETLSRNGIQLGTEWVARPSLHSTVRSSEAKFVSENNEKSVSLQMQESYLPTPGWRVQFCRFEGDLADRAERYEVFVSGDGKRSAFHHVLPESRPGATLEEKEAREIALKRMKADTGLQDGQFEEVSAESVQQPARRDWTFVFRNTQVELASGGQARMSVHLNGGEAGTCVRYIFVPEAVKRENENRAAAVMTFRESADILLTVLIFSGIVGAITCWARGKFAPRLFARCIVLWIPLSLLGEFNHWPDAWAAMNNAEPLANQWLQFGLRLLEKSLIGPPLFGLFFGMVYRSDHLGGAPSRNSIFSGGVAMALFLNAFAGIWKWRSNPNLQSWGDFSEANSWQPWLGGLSECAVVLMLAALLGYLALLARKLAFFHRVGVVLEQFFIVGMALIFGTKFLNAESVQEIWKGALCTAAAFSLGNRFLMGARLECIPVFMLAMTACTPLKNLFQPVYPGHFLLNVTEILGLVTLGWTWMRHLDRPVPQLELGPGIPQAAPGAALVLEGKPRETPLDQERHNEVTVPDASGTVFHKSNPPTF
jgi:hypothetical protein